MISEKTVSFLKTTRGGGDGIARKTVITSLVIGVRSIAISVSACLTVLPVCLSATFTVHVTYGRGSILL